MNSSLDALQPDFVPGSLTMAELRAILVEHRADYPSMHKKADLVEAYEKHIRPKAPKLLKERLKVRASSAGIEDATTSAAATTKGGGGAARAKPPLVAPTATASMSRKSMSMGNLAGIASGDDVPAVPAARSSRTSGRRSSALPSSASTTSLASGRERTGVAPASRRAGMRRSASVEIVNDSQNEDNGNDGDTDFAVLAGGAAASSSSLPAVKRGRGRPKKSVAEPVSTVAEEAEENDEDEDPPTALPPPLRRTVEAEAPVRRTVEVEIERKAPPTPSTNRRQSTGVFSPSGRTPVVEIPAPSEKRRQTIGGESAVSGYKRKAAEAREQADVEAREERRSDSPIKESGFSAYNPFQSGDDASPDGTEKKKKKRRKSSLAPGGAVPMDIDHSPAEDEAAAEPEQSLAAPPSSIRRSSTMQALNGRESNVHASGGIRRSASRPELAAAPERTSRPRPSYTAPSVPPISAKYAGTPSSSKSNTSLSTSASSSVLPSTKSMPGFQKHMAPFEGLATPPEDFRLLVRQAQADREYGQEKEREKQKQQMAAQAAEQRQQPKMETVHRSAVHPSVYETRADSKREDSVDEDAQDEELLEDLAKEPVYAAGSTEEKASARQRALPDSVPVQAIVSTKRGPAPPSTSSDKGLDVLHESASHLAAAPSPSSAVTVRRPASTRTNKTLQTMSVVLPLLTLLGGYGNYWADQKRELGFCNTDTDTNAAVVLRKHAFPSANEAVYVDGRVNWSALSQDILAGITPATCEPCPPHATCADGEVKACSRDYILQPSALAYLFGSGVDPKQSVTSLLFKPACRPDTERLVRVAETASQIAAYLRAHKGDIICNGEEKARTRAAKRGKNGKPEEWSVYGASEDFTKKIIKEIRNPKITEEQFDDIFEEALQDLIGHSEVVYGIDDEAEPWIAAQAADMPLSCRTKLAVYRAAGEHKAGLASLASALLAALYARTKLAQRKAIAEQVDELVPIALQLLQQQEQNHHIDGALTPYPYLAPAQLRDLVLAHEHSPARRAELWKRVEKVVEGNSNVRAKIEEQYGEDIRVWQWVGGTYYIEPALEEIGGEQGTQGSAGEALSSTPISAARRRKSYTGLGPRSSLSKPGTPRINTPGRHITWSRDVKGSPTQAETPQ